MAGRRSFKSDTSFLEKISMGAIGTLAVFKDLQYKGHHPIELERGSRDFKLWKEIKIKRIRVPDILCVRCGVRVESRAKGKFEISMSHSLKDSERVWNAGLEMTDFVAFVPCEKSGEKPIDWRLSGPIQYVSVFDLKQKFDQNLTEQTTPKGAQEGFEMRILWPSVIAGDSGVITSVTDSRIQYRPDTSGRVSTYRLLRKRGALTPLVKEGQKVQKNQILASVVTVRTDFDCNAVANEKYYFQKLSSLSLSQRYAATKALAAYETSEVLKELEQKLEQPEEHIYVKLEAAAGLARVARAKGLDFIQSTLNAESYEHRLEAVIILGEIPSAESIKLLSSVLQDPDQPSEIRAGAAWALGELRDKSALDLLISCFLSVEEPIKIEAARALKKIGDRFAADLMIRFPSVSTEERPGIAWAISHSKNFDLDHLLSHLVDLDARQWAAFIIGTQDQDRYLGEIEKIQSTDPEVYFAATVLWKIMSSWIYLLEEY